MAAATQRRRLLILENDRALRRELETVFSDLDVTACETSDQTLATVRRTEPDVVLFDLGTAHKPRTVAAQSLELLRQILNISPDTKIIAMTEHDARELAVAAVGLGAADFYHKPLDAGVPCPSSCGGHCVFASSRRRTGGCVSAPVRWRWRASWA